MSDRIKEAAEIDELLYNGTLLGDRAISLNPREAERLRELWKKFSAVPVSEEWISVETKLPEPNSDPEIEPHYWVWGTWRKRDEKIPVLAYFYPLANRKGGNFGPVYESAFPRKVTHWQRFIVPPPPSAGKDEPK